MVVYRRFWLDTMRLVQFYQEPLEDPNQEWLLQKWWTTFENWSKRILEFSLGKFATSYWVMEFATNTMSQVYLQSAVSSGIRFRYQSWKDTKLSFFVIPRNKIGTLAHLSGQTHYSAKHQQTAAAVAAHSAAGVTSASVAPPTTQAVYNGLYQSYPYR